MRPRSRTHPIARFGIVLVVFRLIGVFHRYLIQPDAPLAARLSLFVPAVLGHVSTLAAVTSVLLMIATWPRARRPATVVAAVLTALLMIMGQADLTVASITGAPLTPTVFRTFRGVRVVTSNEFLEPLRANWAIAASGLLAFFGVIAWMTRVVFEEASTYAAPPAFGMSAARVGAALVAAVLVSTWPAGPPPPVEIAFAREYLGLDAARLHEAEPAAIASLRSLVGLPASAHWMGDRYPLVYVPAAAPKRGDPLDVVVVMVESLRAEDLSFVTGRRDTATPHLDDLAARSVVFTSYVSNAFPSAPSIVAFHASAWPHRRKEIITDFSAMHFDSLPERLGTLGYETIYVGADPHFDNQDRWLSHWYSGIRDLVAGGTQATDRAIVSRAIDEIHRHDRDSDKPLFAFVSTYSTHYPFRLPADADAWDGADSTSLAGQYRQALHYADAQIGTLLETLAKRPRHDRTLTIVVGDHAFYTNLRQTSGLPENDNEWTAALIDGPADLIGAPRRIADPASHVDMLPTILALVGDDRPTAAVGSNLLGPARRTPAWALAVRPGGLRFDRDGYSAFVDARLPAEEQIRPTFPSRPHAGEPHLPTAAQLTAWVDDWSYLIEHDRIWNPSLLAAGAQARQNEYGRRGLNASAASERFDRPFTR